MKLILNGKPTSQSRPRYVVVKHPIKPYVRIYDERSHKKAIDRTLIMEQLRDQKFKKKFREAISVRMKFFMGASLPSQVKLLGEPKPIRPDIDNMAKYYLDVMNDLVYVDDRFVTELYCEKVYSDKKKVVITINPTKPKVKKCP